MLQSEDLRAALLARYPPDKLFRAERNFNAAQELDVSLLEGDLVGVIKKKDPMGSQNRWLIDNGGEWNSVSGSRVGLGLLRAFRSGLAHGGSGVVCSFLPTSVVCC